MPTNTIDGDLQVRGSIRADGFTLPGSSIGDAEAQSASPFGVNKVRHQHAPLITGLHGTATTARREVIHVARGAGTLKEFRCGVTVANIGAATISFNLLVNGVSVLTTPTQVSSAHAANAVVTGSLTTSPTPYNDGDVFEVSITVAAGGGTLGQGAFAQAIFDEAHD